MEIQAAVPADSSARVLNENIAEQMKKMSEQLPNTNGAILINKEGETIYSQGFIKQENGQTSSKGTNIVSGVISSIANSATQLGNLLGQDADSKPIVQLSFQKGETLTIKSHGADNGGK